MNEFGRLKILGPRFHAISYSPDQVNMRYLVIVGESHGLCREPAD